MNTLKLSPNWVTHSEFRHTEAQIIHAEANCTCGVRERHTHCGVCGYVISRGDWDAKPIAIYTIPKPINTFT